MLEGAHKYLQDAHAALKSEDVNSQYLLKHVGIVGAGQMGAGIALACLQSGLSVTLVDSSMQACERTQKSICEQIERLAARGRISDTIRFGLSDCFRVTSDLAALRSADLVIEAVFENLSVKREVFGALSSFVRPGAIVASNTSGLDIDRISEPFSQPENCIGLHFFSPANVMPLLEIVRGRRSSPESIAVARGFASLIGKVGIVSGNCFGFAANRSLNGYSREAGFLLLEGASPEDIDNALTEFGFPMGPCAMGDLAGHDVALNVIDAMKSEGIAPDDGRLDIVSRELVARGRLGQKSGAGLYEYDSMRKRVPSDAVEEILDGIRSDKGISVRKPSSDEIVERCLLPVINEGAKILEEGIIMRASDLDLIWMYGYGFPSVRGGPMFWADELGLGNIVSQLEQFSDSVPYGEVYWRPAELLMRAARSGSSLHRL